MSVKRISTFTTRAVIASARPARFQASSLLNTSPKLRTTIQRPATTCHVQHRFHSTEGKPNNKVWDFDSIKQLTEQPSTDRVLIDVREPTEFEAGYIPTAINIPVGSAPDALFMPAHEFEDKFGFEKPTADQELVFYCKAGVRSSAAAELARQVGYKNVGEYRGSWSEWSKKGGRSERD
ncbi:Rhodanese-like protein [Aureobasidium pullulans]|nr:Rhodanese-like protein [Aureobasidium pullulans]